MLDAMASDALLREAVEAYDRLVASLDSLGDPELGLGPAYHSGRRALVARAAADAWLVPPTVVTRVRVLAERLIVMDRGEVPEWVDRFPETVLALLERRATMFADTADHPRRRWIDRIGDRRVRPLPSSAAERAGLTLVR